MKSSEPSDVCVFTAICEDDAQWIPQYLAEMSRLGLDFVIYFDRCSHDTKDFMRNHHRCVGSSEVNEDNEFQENHKQRVFNIIPKSYRYALAVDMDEVFEKDAPSKLANLPEADYLDVTWVNLWGDDEHLRIGDGFGPRSRTKFYNLKRQWRWLDPVTNGPIMFIDNERVDSPPTLIDLVCVHHGLKTHELRVQHKERWDRIYTKAIGRQPYKLWEVGLDESIVPQIIDNKYL